jgi:hypothetical protein
VTNRYPGARVSSAPANIRQMSGVVIEPSSRIAKSGNQAHSFRIGSESFTIFSEDALHPLTPGDQVRFDFEMRRYRTGSRQQYYAVFEKTLEILAPAAVAENVKGNVYILSNPSMPGLLKIGFTTGSATKRAGALSGVTGVPTEFRVEWNLPIIGNPHAVERRAHAVLASSRHGKEFFRTTLANAQNACIQAFSELYPEEAAKMDAAFATHAASVFERRQKLSEIAEQRKAAQLQAEEEAAFRQTPEGRWRFNGTTTLSIEAFDPVKPRGEPPFFLRLVGVRYEDSLELRTRMIQQGNSLIWVILADGWRGGARIYKSETYTDLQAMVSHLANLMAEYPILNRSVRIEVENRFVDNPPPLSGDPRKQVFDLLSATDFLHKLSIRSDPPPNASRRRY